MILSKYFICFMQEEEKKENVKPRANSDTRPVKRRPSAINVEQAKKVNNQNLQFPRAQTATVLPAIESNIEPQFRFKAEKRQSVEERQKIIQKVNTIEQPKKTSNPIKCCPISNNKQPFTEDANKEKKKLECNKYREIGKNKNIYNENNGYKADDEGELVSDKEYEKFFFEECSGQITRPSLP